MSPRLARSRFRWLRRRVDGGTLLDIGVGYGLFARLAAGHFDVLGLDLDPAVVRTAVADSAVRGLAGSAYRLPVANESVDVVTCLDVLEHLPDPSLCLEEARRVLRPGGYLHFSTPNPESLGARRKGEASFIYRDPTHVSVLTLEEWREHTAAAGLQEVWAGTDTLWDPPYLPLIPASLQWLLFVGLSQLAWAFTPGFRWRRGENIIWLGRKPPGR